MATQIQLFDQTRDAWVNQQQFADRPTQRVLDLVTASRLPVRVRDTASDTMLAESPAAVLVRERSVDRWIDAQMLAASAEITRRAA